MKLQCGGIGARGPAGGQSRADCPRSGARDRAARAPTAPRPTGPRSEGETAEKAESALAWPTVRCGAQSARGRQRARALIPCYRSNFSLLSAEIFPVRTAINSLFALHNFWLPGRRRPGAETFQPADNVGVFGPPPGPPARPPAPFSRQFRRKFPVPARRKPLHGADEAREPGDSAPPIAIRPPPRPPLRAPARCGWRAPSPASGRRRSAPRRTASGSASSTGRRCATAPSIPCAG